MSNSHGSVAVTPLAKRRSSVVFDKMWAKGPSYHLLAIKIASVAVTLLLWEWYGRGINSLFFSYPSAIARAVPEMIRSGELVDALVASLQPFAVGWSIAIIFGVVIGLLMGRYRVIDALLDAQLTALYSAPTVALIPIFTLWLGLGFEAKVVIIFLSAFFPIAINSHAGAKAITQDLIDIGRVERAREDQIFLKIILPAALPYVMTGIRLSVGRAVIGMVVAEMFTAISGLGGSIVLYSSNYKMDRLFVTVILVAVLGVLLTNLIRTLERRLLPWRK